MGVLKHSEDDSVLPAAETKDDVLIGGDEKHTASEPTSSSTSTSLDETATPTPPVEPSVTSRWRRVYNTLAYCPPHLRWDPEQPPKFSMALNVLFGIAGAFTVANLYYSHPILNVLARDFGVPYVKVAEIPTLAQAGYATGLLFLCPLGDMVQRRPFVLGLVLFTATLRYVSLPSFRNELLFSVLETDCGWFPFMIANKSQHRTGRYKLHCRLLCDPIHHRYHDRHSTAHATSGGGLGTA